MLVWRNSGYGAAETVTSGEADNRVGVYVSRVGMGVNSVRVRVGFNSVGGGARLGIPSVRAWARPVPAPDPPLWVRSPAAVIYILLCTLYYSPPEKVARLKNNSRTFIPPTPSFF